MPKAQPHLMTTKRNVSDISVTSSHLLRFAFFTIFIILGLLGIYAEEDKKPALLSEAVDGEIARRQTQILEAEKIIADGDTLAESGDFESAISKFIQAFNGINPSPLSNDVRNIAKQKFIKAAILRSKQLIEAAEFVSAEELLDQVLQPGIDPKNEVALTIKQRLQDPEWYNKARTPEHLENVKKVKRLLKLASSAERLGAYDKSMKYYADVLRVDRTNTAARRGMLEVENKIIAYHKSSRNVTRQRMLREIDSSWESSVEVVLPDSGPVGGNNATQNEQSLDRKLSSIIVDSINFEDESLEEIVSYLNFKSQELDPLGGGINFVLKLDPTDVIAINARVNLTLRNVPIGEVLKQVTIDTGTNYKVDPYAVQIISKISTNNQLATKTFRVPPDFLSTAPVGEEAVDDPFGGNDNGGGGLQIKRLGAKEFLMKQGVTFPDGASAIYVPGSSTLVVRNTPSNIQLVESFVDSSFSDVPKQVEVHVSLVDISEKELNETGFDWLLGQFDVPGSSQRIFAGGGTEGNTAASSTQAAGNAEYTFIPPWTNIPLGDNPLTAGLRSGQQWNNGDALNNILLGGGSDIQAVPPSVKAPAIFGVGGAFTDPQFQVVMRGLAQAKGADMVTRPSIVTASGQRASIEITRDFIYPTEYDPPEIPQDGGAFGGFGVGGGAPPSFPVTPAHPTSFEARNVGTILEVEPIIGQDNYTVELNLTPEFSQFEGFVNYGTPILTNGTNVLGEFVSVPLSDNRILQPVFRTLRENTSVVVWDGATVVIGGLIEDRNTTMEDKVPFFGNVPVIGKFFKSKGNDRIKRAVIFFVKVNIIDPSGRRINGT